MGKEIDGKVRRHISGWVRHYLAKARESEPGLTQADFARSIGVSATHLSEVINDKKTAGLEVLIALRVTLHADLNDVVDHPPPAVRDPGAASPAPAEPERPRHRKTAS